ncbi:MAG: threonine synthase [Methylobacteriaceae bacterium]|nr:threonine synthase [Methylobacteriaceae bacterium]
MQYPLEIDYEYARVAPDVFSQPPLPGLQRWAPLLPPLMPGLSLGEGGTPLIASVRLANWIGTSAPILLKDESRNPTWSHKDRLNYCITSAAAAVNARGIAVASSGNHGVSAAAYAARAGLPCVVITSPSAQPAFLHFLEALKAEIIIVPVERRWAVLCEVIEATGFMSASNLTRFHTGNPFGPEGYKTIAYEIFLQCDRTMPGTVVVPTGYGELLYGLAKGFNEIVRFGLAGHVPRIVSAEPALRGPLAQAMQRNAAAVEVDGPPSLAAGISCTVSSYRGVKALRDSSSNGMALTFSEATLTEAALELAREGLWQEYSGAAGLAPLREAYHSGPRFEEPIVAILTSTGLKEMPAANVNSHVSSAHDIAAAIARLRAG